MDDFFRGPERPEIVAGRYRLPHPETGAEQSWTRATTHAELPEDSFALTRWQLRQLLLGLRRRPDLLRLIESWADEPGKDDLDAVISTAHEVAGNDTKANIGTAIHGVLQQVDRAWNPELGCPDPAVIATLPEWSTPYVNGYLAELTRQGLTPIPTMTERRVINLALGCAGTLDNLYAEADGAVVLGDKKTGRADHYTERAFAIQLAVYAGSDYLLDPDGGPPIDLRSLGLRADYAVLVHVDPETGACSTYRVDLRRGQYGANLAADVRSWRGERHLLLPYVPPGALPAAAWNAVERAEGNGRHLQAVPAPAGYEATEQGYPQPDTPETVIYGKVRASLPKPDPGTMAVSGGLVDDPAPPAPAQTEQLDQGYGGIQPAAMDDLMKLPKAELQRVLRSLDAGASVAHQRRILAEKILTLQSGGKVATATPRPGADPQEITGPIGGEDPTDPRSPAFHRARLAEIAAAPTVGALGVIHQAVVRVGGDQAWTDAMTEAARARTAQLDAAARAAGPAVPGRAEDLAEAMNALDRAQTSQEIAAIWEHTTVGGSVPERWTPDLAALADRRLNEVTLAAPAANPYAPATAGQ